MPTDDGELGRCVEDCKGLTLCLLEEWWVLKARVSLEPRRTLSGSRCTGRSSPVLNLRMSKG